MRSFIRTLLGTQREVERRAGIRLAFRPDTAAVAVDDALHRRQADAGAFELRDGMQALEDSEQFVGVGHVESGTIVAYDVGHLALLAHLAQLDPRRVAP
jgi:hypothetical protein